MHFEFERTCFGGNGESQCWYCLTHPSLHNTSAQNTRFDVLLRWVTVHQHYEHSSTAFIMLMYFDSPFRNSTCICVCWFRGTNKRTWRATHRDARGESKCTKVCRPQISRDYLGQSEIGVIRIILLQ